MSNYLPASAICTALQGDDVQELAEVLYTGTCRTRFDQAGFCVAHVGRERSSIEFRRLMVDLKQRMSALHTAQTGNALGYLSAARFDQQESTKPHRDGGPDECFLMLGYEPSAVDAELEIIDYSRCAFDMGLTPRELLARHNPMFQAGYELLKPYSTRIPCFAPADYQIVCMNNSIAPHTPDQPAWQGVLHTARILTPDETLRRVINSTMIAPLALDATAAVSSAQIQEFIHTSAVQRRGYDKTHLTDDP